MVGYSLRAGAQLCKASHDETYFINIDEAARCVVHTDFPVRAQADRMWRPVSNADEILGAAVARAEQLAAPELDSRPRRGVAILACMDTRLDIFPTLGVDRGDAHIIRNAGGLVTEDAIRSLTISQRLLGTTEIIVMMHDDCGLLGASDDYFADTLAREGVRPDWRLGGFDDVELTLSRGLMRLRTAPTLLVRDAIRGFVFDPATGVIREVDPFDDARDALPSVRDALPSVRDALPSVRDALPSVRDALPSAAADTGRVL
jgi:carbonic anhydrase